MNEWFKKILDFIKNKPEASAEDALKSVGAPPVESQNSVLSGIGVSPGGISPEVAKVLNETVTLNKALAAQVDSLNKSLAEQTAASDLATKTVKDEQEKQRLVKREEWIKKHTEVGRIPPQNEDDKKYWGEMYDLDAAKAEIAISKIPATNEKNTQQPQTRVEIGGVQTQKQPDLVAAARAEINGIINKGK